MHAKTHKRYSKSVTIATHRQDCLRIVSQDAQGRNQEMHTVKQLQAAFLVLSGALPQRQC